MQVTHSWLKQFAESNRSPARLLIAIVCLAGLVTSCTTPARTGKPALKTRNVFLITTDGLRWQEVFNGAEELLVTNAIANANPEAMTMLFWKPTPEERRKRLMPFMWSEVAANGQIFGNVTKGSISHVTNGKNFSYPGYNEFLTGIPDPRITNNNAILNPQTNVFEWLNNKPRYHGKVAAVVNWDVIPFIMNTPRSQLPVWSGYPAPAGAPVFPAPPILEDIVMDMTPTLSGITFDSFGFHVALDYLDEKKPRAFYVAFNETDIWGHKGEYDRYLVAAKHVDRFIHDLWEYCQSVPQYRDKTTFIITTDHGRGFGTNEWRGHGETISGSDKTWIAVIGPDTPALGERTNSAPVTTSQIAATIAALLGEDYHSAFPQSGQPIADVVGPDKK